MQLCTSRYVSGGKTFGAGVWERFLGFGRPSTDGKQKHALKMGGRDLWCVSLQRDFDICVKQKSAYKRYYVNKTVKKSPFFLI